MKFLKPLVFCSSLLALSVSAASVDVEFKNPDKYRDIEVGNTLSKTKFKEKLFNQLTKVFQTEATALPADYKMKIVMIDIDLAGKVQFGKAVEVRTINDFDFPRLKFYMYLYDKNNKIVFQGVQNLKENKYKHNAFRMKGSQTDFYLEKDLIKKWFRQAIVPAVNKLNA